MIPNTKITDVFTVLNDKGLHTRPATELVKCLSRFKCHISLINQDLTVNGKSLLGILMLAAARGAKIKIEAEGDDAEEAIKALLTLAQDKFYMTY